jgi:hypothetical protein
MSRKLTLQDQVAEYVDRGFSILPLVPGGKTPLTEALPLVHGLPTWKPYQTKAPGTSDVLSWFADYGPDMGGTGLNIGLVTGYRGLYAVDIDGPVIPASLVACHTTTVQTGRPGGGWHLYFTGPEGLRSGRYTVDGTSIELKGVCSYVVAPVSVHSSGTAYAFIEGHDLSAIQPLPGVLMKQLETAYLSDIPRGRGPNIKGRACLGQMWERTLKGPNGADPGERELTLYGFYQLMLTAGHREDYARLWTEKKNANCLPPMTDRELLKIITRGPEAKRPGHIYGVSCPWVKRNLSWVSCEGCHYLNEGVRGLVNGYEFEKALQDKDVSGAVFKVYVALIRQESNTGTRALSLSELQGQTGLSRHTVIAALQTLKGKGLAQG